MDELGIENLVFHPGSHAGIGTDAGIQNIIRGLDQAVTAGPEYSRASGNNEWKGYRDWRDI